jgi:hypothetical protein
MKKWYKSKTIWLQVIAVIIGGIQALEGSAWIPVEYQVAILAVLNIIVRLITSVPVVSPLAKTPSASPPTP